MSVFKLPAGLCNKLQLLIKNLWWNSSSQSKGIHWTKWDLLCQSKKKGGMGFRNLVAFNQALLAKQCWRIISNPELLMSRVLKNRYFPNCDFMDCKLGSNVFYVWRSILWGRQVINAGTRWRIGDGKRAKIFSSNWLPRPHTFKPYSLILLPNELTVSNLMQEGQQWNKDLIFSNFLPEDAVEICRIKIPRETHPDQLIWHYEKRGNYTVKSGYQVALRISGLESASSSSSRGYKWNLIWNLSIPQKVKVFLWKALKNYLPTNQNLCLRKVRNNQLCERCGQATEDILHAPVLCQVSKSVWLSFLSSSKCDISSVDHWMVFSSFFWFLTEKWDMNLVSHAATILWFIWCARNKMVFQDCQESPGIISTRAASIMQPVELLEAGQKDFFRLQPSPFEDWIPPDFPWMKINVDAAVNFETLTAGIECILRNAKGKVLAALHKQTSFDGDVEQAEASAVLEGLILGKVYKCLWLEIETDALNVVDLCTGSITSSKEIYWTILEIKNFLVHSNRVRICFAPRSKNSAAHHLAKIGLKNSEEYFWFDEKPNFIDSLL